MQESLYVKKSDGNKMGTNTNENTDLCYDFF